MLKIEGDNPFHRRSFYTGSALMLRAARPNSRVSASELEGSMFETRFHRRYTCNVGLVYVRSDLGHTSSHWCGEKVWRRGCQRAQALSSSC
ncbi:hypothetical protein AVEN_199215-1 [Araneus ventricosus]|uniref:Uncharacterized protein n=1 Tax=Araneus ventricosus TaxID=182803 RepID=A0A4Y2GZE3_ARAVE|nr:hypothetical protein AVEN_12973-1 [Araneus ventricosus]GBM58319.1 hypothetical protein AVEN_133507-1 [Araneus ventricosus]GBM58330.1 hypothetical protein AVEN_181985-1 [Araneus ventricosus]GBM58335.1 hypothetical protein AVEN_199215-1 [Araneus ventricosus]